MPTHNSYYPPRIGNQIIWLNNFRSKVPAYQSALGYTAPEIAAAQADCDYSVYLLDTWQNASRRFADSGSAAVRHILTGSGNAIVPLPTFDLPATPAPPAAVLPGALKRIFAFVKNLKTRPGYTTAIGADLGVIGSEASDERGAVPDPKGTVRDGEIVITFKKEGHLGVYIEGQTGNETDWHFLAIDTTSPYNDTRPLTVAGQPEKRRYRMCYWDGDPTKEWSNTVSLTFGG